MAFWHQFAVYRFRVLLAILFSWSSWKKQASWQTAFSSDWVPPPVSSFIWMNTAIQNWLQSSSLSGVSSLQPSSYLCCSLNHFIFYLFRGSIVTIVNCICSHLKWKKWSIYPIFKEWGQSVARVKLLFKESSFIWRCGNIMVTDLTVVPFRIVLYFHFFQKNRIYTIIFWMRIAQLAIWYLNTVKLIGFGSDEYWGI